MRTVLFQSLLFAALALQGGQLGGQEISAPQVRSTALSPAKTAPPVGAVAGAPSAVPVAALPALPADPFADVGPLLPPPPLPPKPALPVEKLGEHAAVVLEVQKLLKEGKLEEFYRTIIKHLDERREKRFQNRLENFRLFDSIEEARAFDWLCYLLLTAPLLPNRDFLCAEEKTPYLDFKARTVVYDCLFNDFPTDREKDQYKKWNGVEPPPDLLSPEEQKANFILHLEYRAYMHRWGRYVSQEMEARFQNVLGSAVPAPRYSSQYYGLGDEVFKKIDQKIRMDFKKIRNTFRPDDQFRVCHNYTKRINMVLIQYSKSSLDSFVRIIIRVYPNDVGKIHEYLRKGGLVSDGELWEAISRIYPYTSESAYFYQGLTRSK